MARLVSYERFVCGLAPSIASTFLERLDGQTNTIYSSIVFWCMILNCCTAAKGIAMPVLKKNTNMNGSAVFEHAASSSATDAGVVLSQDPTRFGKTS